MYWAVHFIDEVTAIKRFNVVEADTNDEATRSLSHLFAYGTRFRWTGTEPYTNVEEY